MLERFKPGVGDTNATGWRMGFPVLALAVPVRSPGHAESQALGDPRQPLLDRRRVAGMADFDTIEPLILKDAQLRFLPVITQWRGCGQSAHGVPQTGDFPELGERLLDVRGAAAAQIAAESVADGVAHATVDECPRYVGPAQRPSVSSELRLDVFQIDPDAEALQLGDDLFTAPAPRGTRVAQERLEALVGLRQKQREDVQLAPRRPPAELTSGDDAHAELRALLRRARHTVGRIVIGERDGDQVDRARTACDVRRLALAVGGRRMAVQINVRRNQPRVPSTPAATGGAIRAARARRAP